MLYVVLGIRITVIVHRTVFKVQTLCRMLYVVLCIRITVISWGITAQEANLVAGLA